MVFVTGSVIAGCESFFHEPRNMLFVGFDLRLSPEEDAKLYEPFMDYLSKKTGYDFRLRFTSEYEDTQENLGTGKVQFAAIGAVSYINAVNKYGAKILARGLNKNNEAMYQSIIFTRPDSDIRTLKEIKGRSFAFGSEDSTQGHLIPREMLDDAGITLDDLSKYEYTGSHKNAVDAVMNGTFDAGGGQDTLVKKMAKQGKIKIVKVSKYYPSSGMAANKDVSPEIMEKVKKALLELDPLGRHKDMLPGWEQTEMPNGFTDAKEEDYTELREMMHMYGFN